MDNQSGGNGNDQTSFSLSIRQNRPFFATSSSYVPFSATLPFDDSLYVKELEKRVAASKKRQPAANPLALVESTFEITDQKIMDRYFGISRDN